MLSGINTMFNTGSVVGVCSNTFGAGFQPKYVPSFSWGGSQGFSEYILDKAWKTAQDVVSQKKLTYLLRLSLCFHTSTKTLWANGRNISAMMLK